MFWACWPDLLLLYFECRIARGSGQVVDGDKGIVYTHKDLTSHAWLHGGRINETTIVAVCCCSCKCCTIMCNRSYIGFLNFDKAKSCHLWVCKIDKLVRSKYIRSMDLDNNERAIQCLQFSLCLVEFQLRVCVLCFPSSSYDLFFPFFSLATIRSCLFCGQAGLD